MLSVLSRIGKILLHILFCLVLIFVFIWCGFAFWYQLPGGKFVFYCVILVWILIGLFVIFSEWKPKWRWKTRTLTLCLLIIFAGWWSTIRPSLTLDWDPALSKTMSGTVEGNLVHVKNIRDFDWITPDEGVPHWFDATYDLDMITGVDIYSSYWMGPWISHTLVGFSFADGRHLVFSAEIRRQKGQQFDAIGGFFKEFNLALLVATEEDIIFLRSNIRKENIYRYPLIIPKEQAKELFLLYTKAGNELSQKAEFYNTMTTNCTTVIFKLVRVLEPGIPSDWRILLSGQLPSYLYDHKFIDTSLSLNDEVKKAHIGTEAEGPRTGYSQRIRQKQ